MNTSTSFQKSCLVCGKVFTPCSPFAMAAKAQKYCSRKCSNKANGLARRGRKWGQASPETSKKAGVSPETIFLRLTGARLRYGKYKIRLIDGMDAFDDVRIAVDRAYARMIREGRIIESKFELDHPYRIDYRDRVKISQHVIHTQSRYHAAS